MPSVSCSRYLWGREKAFLSVPVPAAVPLLLPVPSATTWQEQPVPVQPRYGGRDTFLPHVVLNVFFPYFLDLVRHEVEERQLAGIVCLLAPSGHAFPSLSERREDGAMLAALSLPAGMFIRGEFQLFSVFNVNPPIFFKKDNLVSRLHVESFTDFSGNRDLALVVSLASSICCLLVQPY